MADRVFIQGLELASIIGVAPAERQAPRTLRLDVEISTDCATAGRADDLTLTIDYLAVARLAREVAERSRFFLVEALAERIAAALLKEFPAADRLRLRLAKPGALGGAIDAGVEIERRREERR